MISRQALKNVIDASMGRIPCDLILRNARVVNVFTGDTDERDIGIRDGYIAGFSCATGNEVVDLKKAYVIPGLIDAHQHIESSMLEPARWAHELLPHGVTAAVCDPHEIANVLGVAGIRFMIERSRGLPLTFYFMLPSCVPATPFETAGAVLSAADLEPLYSEDRVLGLAEVMNFPGVFLGLDFVLDKVHAAESRGVRIDGHAPGLGGAPLQAYVSAGIATDHECVTAAEAREKLELGMKVIIREGTAARNLDALIGIVDSSTIGRCMLGTDDKHPDDLRARGHINQMVRRAAVALGDPVAAIKLATINTASHYGLSRRGAVAPGYIADLLVLDDLESFNPRRVYTAGKLTAQDGASLWEVPAWTGVWPNRFNMPRVTPDWFVMRTGLSDGPAIRLNEFQIVTGAETVSLKRNGDTVLQDTSADVLKLVVVERYTGRGGCAAAPVIGFGLKKGAIATSVAHDSHNVICVGVDDRSIAEAVNMVRDAGGGLCVTDGAGRSGILKLPVAGLMTGCTGDEVISTTEKLLELARGCGCRVREPFMALSFLALPVIPALKLTDKGLFDALKFSMVDAYRTGA